MTTQQYCDVFYRHAGGCDFLTVPYDSSTSVVQFRKACEEQLKVKDQTFKSLALFKPSVDAIDAFNVNHVMLQDPEAFTPIHVLSNIERWIPTSAHRCLKLDLLNGPPPPLSVSSHPVMRLNATNSSKFTHYDLELNHIAWAEHYDDYVKAVKEEAESLRPVTEQHYKAMEEVWTRVGEAFRKDKAADVSESQSVAAHFIQLRNWGREYLQSDYEDKRSVKEGSVYWLFLGSLKAFLAKFKEDFKEYEFGFWNRNWPDGVPMITSSDTEPERLARFEPKSDFCLWKRHVPYLLGEVYSEGVNDCEKLLVQGAYLVQLYERGEPHFVLPLIYIDKDFTAKVYYMWADDEKTRYTSRDYALMKEDRAPHFLALLYNLCTRDIVYDPENAATLVRQAKEVPTQGSLNSRHGGSTREQGGGSKGGKGKGKNRKRGPEDEQGGGNGT